MINLKTKLTLLAVFACVSSQASAIPIFGENLQRLSTFSKEYTTTGADSSVNGSVMTGGVGTTGAGGAISGDFTAVGALTIGGISSTAVIATVGGNITSGGALTTGDSSTVGGDITAGGAASVGASGSVGGNMASAGAASTGAESQIGGNVSAGGAATVGVGALVTGTVYAVGAYTEDLNSKPQKLAVITSNPVDAALLVADLIGTIDGNKDQILAAQLAFSKMVATEDDLLADMNVSTVLFSGVYQAPSLSTTAEITLTLDGQNKKDQYWVFNIGDILKMGANSKIVMVNGANSDSVIWNAGGYADFGDGSSFLGTLLARQHVVVGANAKALGPSGSCGGLFSALSYVSTGDAAQIGGDGCRGIASGFHFDEDLGMAYFQTTQTTVIPEPATGILFVTSIALLGLSMRRRKVYRIVA
jgi:cytoskeletal protein CcmA (bactofilin family)